MPEWLTIAVLLLAYVVAMRWVLPASVCPPEWLHPVTSSLDVPDRSTNRAGGLPRIATRNHAEPQPAAVPHRAKPEERAIPPLPAGRL